MDYKDYTNQLNFKRKTNNFNTYLKKGAIKLDNIKFLWLDKNNHLRLGNGDLECDMWLTSWLDFTNGVGEYKFTKHYIKLIMMFVKFIKKKFKDIKFCGKVKYIINLETKKGVKKHEIL